VLALFEIWVVVYHPRVYVNGAAYLKSNIKHKPLTCKSPQFKDTWFKGLFNL